MINITPWDNMLRTYVKAGRVDYARWQGESSEALDQWLIEVSTVEIDQLDRDNAIAFLLNLYNALVIKQVLQQYPIDSIRPTFLGIPKWLGFLLFFKKSSYTLNDHALSLDAIEHGTLRSRYSEPRMHFALVCASEGCPLLRSEAYFPKHLNAQLTEDARRFINNSEKVRYDAANNTLYCSKIFKWYKADFLNSSGSIARYVQPYLANVQLPPTVSIDYLPYSWQLNQRTSS
ncbi:MAG: DUF547 domain-containing protein [Phormidesmis sp.]